MPNPLLPHKALITAVNDETADTRTYRLRLAGPGPGAFAARPGQFNMVGLPGIGEAPISMSGLGATGDFDHTIRAVGRVTRYLAGLAAGDTLFVRGPYGRPWPLDAGAGQDLLLVAGGVGLAPLRPVIEQMAGNKREFRRVILVCGARSPAELLFSREFAAWQQKGIELHLTVDAVPAGTRWEHGTGLVTAVIDRLSLEVSRTAAFVCGPEIMMRFVARQLIFRGLPPSAVHVSLERRMKCGVAQCGHCQHGPFFVCQDGPVFRYSEVRAYPDSLL